MVEAKTEDVKRAIALPNFTHPELLEIALTHPDYIREVSNLNRLEQKKRILEYQGLENLGYVVFSKAISYYLRDRFSDLGEATITIIKSDVASREILAKFAVELNLRDYSLLAESYEWKHKSEQNHILASMFEAVLGAVYLELERDLSLTETWLSDRFLEPAVNRVLTEVFAEEVGDAEADFQIREFLEALGISPPRCSDINRALLGF